jgi:hypothetical protein
MVHVLALAILVVSAFGLITSFRVQIIKHCARLLLAFHFCRSDICRGDKELPKDLLNHTSKPGDNEIKMFVPLESLSRQAL